MPQLHLLAANISALAAAVRDRAGRVEGTYVIAIDGRSGAGKSTLAARLAELLDARLIDGDAFFRGGVELRRDTPEERANACIDWELQRSALEMLRAGGEARYFAFDWATFDGRLEAEPTYLGPCSVVVLEGVYSARPELGSLVDLRVLLRVSDETRTARLTEREGSIGPWERQWHEAEEWYFANAAPLPAFDIVVDGDDA